MHSASTRTKPGRRKVIVKSADLPPHSPAEVSRLRELPDGEADGDAPELGDDFFAAAKPTHVAIPKWPIRPAGRPAASDPAPASAIVSLRLPRSLRTAIQRRAKALHISFNAAMQLAAATWIGEPDGRISRQRTSRSR
jgi:hypothetical protein